MTRMEYDEWFEGDCPIPGLVCQRLDIYSEICLAVLLPGSVHRTGLTPQINMDILPSKHAKDCFACLPRFIKVKRGP